ncbi:MAG: DNA repair protein RadC [Gemmatimonadaceae bacterium]|nr:DNA repair protein RadC [Gemmatimonadaceae bacterium]
MPSVLDLPPSDRPRERLRALGAAALTTSELLGLLFGVATGGRPATDLAAAVLTRAGGTLRRLGQVPLAALTEVPGLGEVRALAIHAALELGRRLAAEGAEEGEPMRGPRDVWRYYAARLEGLPVEEFHVAILDSQHRLERDVLVSRGILNSSLVHPREVFREAIAERAASLVLVHNHPSGDPTPSPDDRAVTSQLVAAGRLLDIPVQDHIVIGRGRYLSFAEAGLL